jgi:hypothetical protein
VRCVNQCSKEDLLNIGFQDIGHWAAAEKGHGIRYVLDGANVSVDQALIEAPNALYAFVQGEAITHQSVI